MFESEEFGRNFIQIIIPFSALDEPSGELLKRLSYPNYITTYLYLRRFVCRDKTNPVAGKFYAEGKLVSYVSRSQIASVLSLDPTRISKIFSVMQEWGDIVEAGYDGRHKIWELGRIERIETPDGEVKIEVFYFDLHIAGKKEEMLAEVGNGEEKAR